MANKRSPQKPKNDFEYDEGEVCGFTSDAPILGNCIASFSFDDDAKVEHLNPNLDINLKNTTLANKINVETNTTNPTLLETTSNPTKDIFDNRKTPFPNRATPSIDGETPNIKRSYTLRSSTIRKINELKSIHPDINICVSSIVDVAIDHYHNYISKEGGCQ